MASTFINNGTINRSHSNTFAKPMKSHQRAVFPDKKQADCQRFTAARLWHLAEDAGAAYVRYRWVNGHPASCPLASAHGKTVPFDRACRLIFSGRVRSARGANISGINPACLRRCRIGYLHPAFLASHGAEFRGPFNHVDNCCRR